MKLAIFAARAECGALLALFILALFKGGDIDDD